MIAALSFFFFPEKFGSLEWPPQNEESRFKINCPAHHASAGPVISSGVTRQSFVSTGSQGEWRGRLGQNCRGAGGRVHIQL